MLLPAFRFFRLFLNDNYYHVLQQSAVSSVITMEESDAPDDTKRRINSSKSTKSRISEKIEADPVIR